MKNPSTILFFAFIFLLFSCKKEEEKSIITYKIGREIAQSLNMMQLCIHESDRIVAEEYGDALIRFGDGACDNKFWLEWSSGAAVLVPF